MRSKSHFIFAKACVRPCFLERLVVFEIYSSSAYSTSEACPSFKAPIQALHPQSYAKPPPLATRHQHGVSRLRHTPWVTRRVAQGSLPRRSTRQAPDGPAKRRGIHSSRRSIATLNRPPHNPPQVEVFISYIRRVHSTLYSPLLYKRHSMHMPRAVRRARAIRRFEYVRIVGGVRIKVFHVLMTGR